MARSGAAASMMARRTSGSRLIARKRRTIDGRVSGLPQLHGEVGEAVGSRELDGALPNARDFETPIARFRHGDGEGVVGFDGTAHAEVTKRALGGFWRARAPAAGASLAGNRDSLGTASG